MTRSEADSTTRHKSQSEDFADPRDRREEGKSVWTIAAEENWIVWKIKDEQHWNEIEVATEILQRLLDVFIPGITAYEYSSIPRFDDSAHAARYLIAKFRVPRACVDSMIDLIRVERIKRKRRGPSLSSTRQPAGGLPEDAAGGLPDDAAGGLAEDCDDGPAQADHRPVAEYVQEPDWYVRAKARKMNQPQ